MSLHMYKPFTFAVIIGFTFRLYADPKQKPRYNLLFVLSGGGNLNYFGTKSLLEEQLDDPG